MKNKLSIIMCLSIAVLAGCSRSVSRDKWESLEPGMTIDEIEEQIGSPKEDITDQRTMLDLTNEEISAYETVLSTSISIGSDNDLTEPMEDALMDLNVLHSSIENQEDVRIYQYEVNDSDSTNDLEIYFYRGEVFYYSAMYDY